jgi:membrane-associated phospholipid phosphatase
LQERPLAPFRKDEPKNTYYRSNSAFRASNPCYIIFMQSVIKVRWRIALLGCVFFVMAGAPFGPFLQAQDTQGSEQPAHSQSTAPPSRDVSWKLLGPNVLHDQKQIWLFPKSLVHGKHWIPALAFAGVTAGLIALDSHDDPYFRRTQTFNQFNQVMSSRNAILGMALVPTSFYALGLDRHDSYMEKTVQLAGEAVLDSEILDLVIRDVTRRIPPSQIPPYGDFSDSFFMQHKGPFYLGNGGFPSGHTIAAFSIATIFAERYRRHRWVPWVAYGLAAVVGFSRISLQDHFPSDVFAGAALGFTISHFVVLRPR